MLVGLTDFPTWITPTELRVGRPLETDWTPRRVGAAVLPVRRGIAATGLILDFGLLAHDVHIGNAGASSLLRQSAMIGQGGARRRCRLVAVLSVQRKSAPGQHGQYCERDPHIEFPIPLHLKAELYQSSSPLPSKTNEPRGSTKAMPERPSPTCVRRFRINRDTLDSTDPLQHPECCAHRLNPSTHNFGC